MLHGDLVISTVDLNSHSVVLKPSIRLGLTVELADSSRQPEVGRNHRGSDGSAETLWSGDVHSAAGGYISVITLSVGSIPVDQTLNDDGSRIKAWFPGVDWNSSPATVLASVILLPRHIGSTPPGRSGHSTSIVVIDSVIILLIVPVLIVSVAMPFTPRGRSGAMS